MGFVAGGPASSASDYGACHQSLAISRLETDAVLTRNGVVEELLTPEELAEQLVGLRKLGG